ncbi:uncharacterized protein [Triticum aestivum]|uniref:uncharacterized protein n=1 Tax=Triticum aestivum TaxID=4565 RepID=UPI001D01FDEA|nr:uncharacterized protein LOC123114876 [Triticum aestivum]
MDPTPHDIQDDYYSGHLPANARRLEDVLAWAPESRGIFSIRRAYKTALEERTNTSMCAMSKAPDGVRKAVGPQAGDEVESVSLPPPQACWSDGVRRRRRDAPPGAYSYGACSSGEGGGVGGSGGQHSRDGSEAWCKEEQGEDAAGDKEIPMLLPSFAASAQPRSPPAGMGVSPAGSRFWLLAGEDSNGDAGTSSDLEEKVPRGKNVDAGNKTHCASSK